MSSITRDGKTYLGISVESRGVFTNDKYGRWTYAGQWSCSRERVRILTSLGVDAIRRRSVLGLLASEAPVCPLHPHAVHRAAETGATRIGRAWSNRKRVGQGARVRACVRACVRGCGRTRACVRARLHALRACVRESSLRVRSYAALVRSAYTCVCEWCMHVRVCVREVGASLGRGKM